MKTGSDVYLQLTTEHTARKLYKGTVTEWSDDRGRVLMKNADLTVARSSDVTLFHHHDDDFLSQPARVEDLSRGPGSLILDLETTGDPVSADSRKHRRVNPNSLPLQVLVGRYDRCSVSDISPVGFSIVSRNIYKPGTSLKVRFQYEDLDFSGHVTVRSVAPLTHGLTRYGVVSSGLEAELMDRGLAVLTDRLVARR